MSTLSIYFPKPIYIYYDPIIFYKKKNIVISNHLSEYDWLMILAILYKLQRYDDMCIILKQSLKNIPLLGYGMSYFGFIFLNRKLDADKEILKKGLNILKNKQKYDLLIFPEGTYIDKVGKEISDNYVKNNPVNLKGTNFYPQEVLLPRVTGFNIIYDNLGNDMDGVIDMTLFTNPYISLPQEKYKYHKALTDFDDRIGYSCFIEFVDKPAKKDFIFNRFKNKDEFIKKYKKVCPEGFNSLEDFITKFKKFIN
ncbi:lysocardiolipin acyltransferase 1 [Vairimorpha apis BRL 01]|uniref:Lysocardiolipin acyltransferase 1 n=1 Tax=Vairimorpha apis BRL 01 TaxID=1037528 RepID=T0ML09_9MICR|nr:lysocardiolipin acyltransferase 1 [Vairimorpha apis BRL 01]